MNLNNLPKDMLVEMVSQLQDEKEKEYSEYVVIPYEAEDYDVEYFTNEEDLKKGLLKA